MYLARVIEVLAGIALVFGIRVRKVAWLVGAFRLVTSAASFKVSMGNWIWLASGCEYPAFWALCRAVLATNG